MSYIRIAVIAAAYLLSSRSSSLFRPSCTPPPGTFGRIGLDPDTPARAPPSMLALANLPSSLSFTVAQTTAAGAARPPASNDEWLWGVDASLPPAMRGWVRCEGGEGRRNPTFEPRPAPPLVTISFAWPRQAACARQRSALVMRGGGGVFAGWNESAPNPSTFFFWTRKEVTSPKEVTPKERAASKLPGLAGAPIPCASRCAFHCRPGRALLPPPDLLALRVHSASSLFAHPVLLSAKTATSTNPELASVLPGWTSACYRGLRQSSAWA